MASLISVVPVNLAASEFNLVSIQFSLTRQGNHALGKTEQLQNVIKSSRNWHKLYDLDNNTLGEVIEWAATLTDQEIDLLSLKIKNQTNYFWHWNVFGVMNAGLFLNKGSNDCYCDPFDPEPRVYRGHIILSPYGDVNERINTGRRAVQEINPGLEMPEHTEYIPYVSDSSCERYHIGKLRFTISDKTGSVEVKMNRKMFLNKKKYYSLTPPAITRLRSVLELAVSKKLCLVDINVRPVGKIWHSYGLDELFKVLESNVDVFYQINSGNVMVAGIPTKEDYCV